jgi:hypothetical protein
MQNPILKVLSTLTNHGVQHLLMGGQACVFYGAAQFSRDVDLAILADSENLNRLRSALDELQAVVIAVPSFDRQFLEKGMAVHFRCLRSDLAKLRIDVMAVMRGVDAFPLLWTRRTTIALEDHVEIPLMNVADLVRAKKTQRDRDWPMIQSLVDAHYEQHQEGATDDQKLFWLREGRSPRNLISIAQRYPALSTLAEQERPLVRLAATGAAAELTESLAKEQKQEQEMDRAYWEPLLREIEILRINRPRNVGN